MINANYFENEKKRIIKALSKKKLDFFYVGSCIRDTQNLVRSFKDNIQSDTKTLDHLDKFCDNIWDEGYKCIDGWELSIPDLKSRIEDLRYKN